MKVNKSKKETLPQKDVPADLDDYKSKSKKEKINNKMKEKSEKTDTDGSTSLNALGYSFEIPKYNA